VQDEVVGVKMTNEFADLFEEFDVIPDNNG